MKKEYESPVIEIALFDFSSAVCHSLNPSGLGWEEEDEGFGDDSGNGA